MSRQPLVPHLPELLLTDAVRVVNKAMAAVNGRGQPDWPVRLRAADLTFRLGGVYERAKKPPPEPENTIEIDFSEVHPQIARFVVIHGGKWPTAAQEKQLESGTLAEDL